MCDETEAGVPDGRREGGSGSYSVKAFPFWDFACRYGREGSELLPCVEVVTEGIVGTFPLSKDLYDFGFPRVWVGGSSRVSGGG